MHVTNRWKETVSVYRLLSLFAPRFLVSGKFYLPFEMLFALSWFASISILENPNNNLMCCEETLNENKNKNESSWGLNLSCLK